MDFDAIMEPADAVEQRRLEQSRLLEAQAQAQAIMNRLDSRRSAAANGASVAGAASTSTAAAVAQQLRVMNSPTIPPSPVIVKLPYKRPTAQKSPVAAAVSAASVFLETEAEVSGDDSEEEEEEEEEESPDADGNLADFIVPDDFVEIEKKEVRQLFTLYLKH